MKNALSMEFRLQAVFSSEVRRNRFLKRGAGAPPTERGKPSNRRHHRREERHPRFLKGEHHIRHKNTTGNSDSAPEATKIRQRTKVVFQEKNHRQ